jgi:hypothetical protein
VVPEGVVNGFSVLIFSFQLREAQPVVSPVTLFQF